ncbi:MULTISPECIES: YtrH family sporulation protein [Clostridium]|uniref:YtrH family sporulation protein n=1 Tax=Clostridium TaxID=1485 RepID=UPI000DFF53D6|nr:YtrH family sporulation protein [Clostridium sporogenes]MCW6087509.1 YtrH family sporulation protein [Clostridium sporogenes]STC75820.1 Sporulation membrane protein ytrH [Clostridium botulinum]
MKVFLGNLVYSFMVSFGVIVGASAFSGIAAILLDHPPLKIMSDISNSVKIWAVATALGGTFSSFSILEEGIFKGELRGMFKQIFYILASLIGANLAVNSIELLQKWGEYFNR